MRGIASAENKLAMLAQRPGRLEHQLRCWVLPGLDHGPCLSGPVRPLRHAICTPLSVQFFRPPQIPDPPSLSGSRIQVPSQIRAHGWVTRFPPASGSSCAFVPGLAPSAIFLFLKRPLILAKTRTFTLSPNSPGPEHRAIGRKICQSNSVRLRPLNHDCFLAVLFYNIPSK
jgi:hypothetical protein